MFHFFKAVMLLHLVAELESKWLLLFLNNNFTECVLITP